VLPCENCWLLVVSEYDCAQAGAASAKKATPMRENSAASRTAVGQRRIDPEREVYEAGNNRRMARQARAGGSPEMTGVSRERQYISMLH